MMFLFSSEDCLVIFSLVMYFLIFVFIGMLVLICCGSS